MDARNLIFPMTAGDLVQSASVVSCQKRGDGVELHLLEVLSVRNVDHATRLEILFRDRVTLERSTVELDADTPILISEISRS